MAPRSDLFDSSLLFAQMAGRIAEFLVPALLLGMILVGLYFLGVLLTPTPPTRESLCRYCTYRDQADRAACTACVTRRA